MNTLALSAASTPPAASTPFLFDTLQEQEILSFRLGEQEYGIPLLCVQEIRSYQAPTRLAGSNTDLLGVMDLRGQIVPVFDLRQRFGLPGADFDAFTVIVVIQIDERCVGVVADAVNDVVGLQADQVRPMPALKAGPDQNHLRAVACLAERRVVLLDIESLLREPTRRH